MIGADDRALLARSLDQALDRGTAATVDRALADVGWHDALAEWGLEVAVMLFDLQGRVAATSTALDDVLAHALGVDAQAAVMVPGFAAVDAPGRVQGAVLIVDGLASGRILDRDRVLVASADGRAGRVLALDAVTLVRRPVHGIDPSAGLVAVSGEVDPDLCTEVADGESWERAFAAGQVVLAAELVGLGKGMLELARSHALARVQFDRPIASFQAVRHRLADTLLALEAADAAVTAAATSPAPDLVTHARLAKALAGTASRTAARHCQQVLAGIGFTAEHRFHRYLRRAVLLDEVLGSARVLTRTIGAEAIATHRVPVHLPL